MLREYLPAAAFQRKVLSRRDAIHIVRLGDRVHVSVGRSVPGRDQTKLDHLLEHAQLYHALDGGLRLRSKKGRTGLQKVISCL